jgi:branched-chain amino acid transport system ATP-binding protein
MKLTIQDLSYRVGDCTLLSGITVEMAGCGAVGLIGPNGSGKSMLANVVSGFIRPTSGRVLFNQHVLTSLYPSEIAKLGVGRMFQTQQLAWNLTVTDNVKASIEQHWYCISQGRAKQRQMSTPLHTEWGNLGEEIIVRVGLQDVMNVPARNLSYGQQRLLAIAKVIAFSPKLMVLDEPFAGLKETARERVLGLLEEEKHRRMILIIDHALSAVRSIASGVWFMNRGMLTQFADYEQLERSDTFRRHYLGAKEISYTSAPTVDPGGVPMQDISSPEERQKQPVLQVRALDAGYDGTPVIRNVYLDLFAGDVLCIIGLNGSGKSTVLRTIAGIVKRFAGSIELFDMHIESLRPDERVRKGIRLLPQDQRLFRSLSIEDNLLLGAAKIDAERPTLRGLPWDKKKRLKHVVAHGLKRLESTGIPSQKRPAGTYSGGEQSRVALVQLEFGHPKVILLDEPTSGVDGVATVALVQQVHEWRRQGVPIVIVEHDLSFVLSVATRVAVMKSGTLEELSNFKNEGIPGFLRNLIDTHPAKPV